MFPASGVQFVVEELLHVAAVVKPGERVADGLETERFTKVKVGHRESDVFGDGGGELAATSKGVGVRVRVRSREKRIVILDDQRSERSAVGDKRNADRSTFAEQVRETRFGASTGMSMGGTAAKSPTLFGREDLLSGAKHAPLGDGLGAVSGGAEQ
jgi:hypothetical protein